MFNQLFATIVMFLVSIQKIIRSVDDCASMLNSTTSTALLEQTAVNADRLAKLNQAIADNEYEHDDIPAQPSTPTPPS